MDASKPIDVDGLRAYLKPGFEQAEVTIRENGRSVEELLGRGPIEGNRFGRDLPVEE